MVRLLRVALVLPASLALLVPQTVTRRAHIAPKYATGFAVEYDDDADADGIVLHHDYDRCADDDGAAFAEEELSDISDMIALRMLAKRDRNYDVADELRAELADVFDVYLDDGLREWRTGAPPSVAAAPVVAVHVPTGSGFAVEDPEADRSEYVPAGRKPLDAQADRYAALVAGGAAPAQVWVRADGLDRDFFVGRVASPAGAADALSLQIDLVEWSARELHLPIGGKRPGSLRWFLADDAEDAKVAAWEATPGLEAQPSDLTAPAAASEHLAKKPAEPLKPKDAGFLAAKSPLPPTTLGNLIKDYRDHAKGGVGKGYEAKKPTGSAAGNTGRAQRPS